MAAGESSREGRCELAFEDFGFEVDPAKGGRVTSFRLGGAEALGGRDLDPNNYGSTLWTSPQSDWGWPPPPEFDDRVYSASAEGETLTLVGPPSLALGIRLEKRFAIDRARRAIVATYSIHNLGEAAKTCAPWEVTRVPPGGLTFFATGERASGPLPVETRRGVTWYAHRPETLDDVGRKHAADGKQGYVAHASRDLLLVKSFVDLPPEQQAPGEGEVEVYGNNRYVEVEAQGPYASIEPGETKSWVVTWYLRKIAAPARVAVGNAALLAQALATFGGEAAKQAGPSDREDG